MGLLEASPGVVAWDGELVDRASCEDFDAALDLLRSSSVDAPLVDLTGVGCVSRRGIGVLIALWFDMDAQGRRLGLVASDRVWSVMERVGVAYIFGEKAYGAPPARAGCPGARCRSGAMRREPQ